MARNLHVLMFPWSAFGHLMPFFQLSVALAKAGIKISFISTPRNIQRLPKVPPSLASLIDFVAFPLPVIDRKLLPEDAEATVDIPSDNIQYLKFAYDLLQQPFKQFISDQRPDWVLTDIISYWAAEICQDRQIPVIYFSVYSAFVYAFFFQKDPLLPDDVQQRTKPSPESLTVAESEILSSSVAYKSFEATQVYEGSYLQNASGISDNQRITRIMNASQAIAFRSCPEYESESLNKCEELLGKPVLPIGLILPDKPEDRNTITDKYWTENFRWLDGQKPGSVLFVGFGSECKLSKEQVHEIAKGVELSGLPFLWSLRKPDWASINDDVLLPPGFCDRTHGKGMVCIGWAPQQEILAHPSIGGCLFHGGWGSIIEMLQFGHRLVVLPLVLDQPLNARLLVEKGLAVEVDRTDEGSFSGGDVARATRQAMASEEGEKLGVRASKASKIFGNRKLQEHYLDKFVQYLKENAHTTLA